MTHIRSACLAVATLTALLSPALAQSASKQDGASSAPAMSPAPARKGQTAAPAASSELPGLAELTEQECRNLGGAVHTAPQCKTTGKRCVIRLAGGQVNAPCIDEFAKEKK